jgi:bifunctional UDP-N-acetylglucosamine pyrophosphorylase/glucosamine-1-phosphate N-acetyltransferase
VAGVAFRSRSGWLGVDMVCTVTFVLLVGAAARRLYDGFALQLLSWSLILVVALAVPALWIASALQVARGRTDLRGETVIGEGCVIGPETIIEDSQIGSHVEILKSMLEGAVVEDDVDMGPFAHLRKGAHLCKGVHMGNFGEVKDSTLGPGVKMGHFSYLGNATIGAGTNIGAGTITANYEGERKHPTEIGEQAFIGSDTMLVAPVKVGDRSRTGAGAVVTKDIPADTLAVGVPARAIRKLEPKKKDTGSEQESEK